MIDVYIEKTGQTWFGVALKGDSVIATNFASTKDQLLDGLKANLPSYSFSEVTRKSELGQKVIEALKSVYDGKEP